MIRLENVSKGFPGGSNAVSDLSLDIPDGQTCVLIGPSGCGKTTTLRMINRLIEPDAGRILVDGQDTRGVDPAAIAASWEAGEAKWRLLRAKYLLYY